MLTHVVLMKFADPADGEKARELLEGLPARVPEIRALRVGLDVVRGEASYDLCLITEHESLEELKGYQGHPAHVEVAGWLRPRLTSRASVDF